MATSDVFKRDYCERIRDLSDTIIDSMNINDVLDNMVSFCALTIDDRSFIDAQPTLARKNRMFLEVILSRGNIACEVFVDLLREDRHYRHLVEKIEQHIEAYDELDSRPVRLDDESIEQMVPEYKVKLQKNYSKITSVKFQHMFDFLLAKDVLSFTDYEEISAQSTLSDRNRKLVDLLMLKDQHAYEQFLETLRVGETCLCVAQEIESTIVTKEEQKQLFEKYKDRTHQEIEKLSIQIEHLSNENAALKSTVTKLKDPIPAAMREHFKVCIEDWKIEEEHYFVTRATRHILQEVDRVNCLVVTGSSGNGKTALMHHVALQLQREKHFEIIPFVVDLSDIIRYFDPRKKQVFVVDDICGKVTVNVQTVDWWYTHINQLETILSKGHVKLLATCRLQIYNDPKFRRVKNFFANEYNMLSSDLHVLPEERLLIANKYFAKSLISYVKDLFGMYDFFPLLCKLYHRRPTIDARVFFSKPIDGIREDLLEIQRLDKMQYCAIAMVILFNNRFKIEWLKPSKKNPEIIAAVTDISKECFVDLRTQSSRKEFKAHLDALLKTYIKKSENNYRMIHDKIYDIGAVVCGQHLSECFIRHADYTFIGDRFRFQSTDEIMSDDSSSDEDFDDKDNSYDEFIVLSNDEEENYFDRLIQDLENKITYSAFHNKQLQNHVYRSKFIHYCTERQQFIEDLIRAIEEDGQRVSDYTYRENDFRNLRLPLIESAFEGHEDIVSMLLGFKCDINLCDKYNRSALQVACTFGYFPIVRLLLEKGAKTTLNNWLGQSALYSACEAGHRNIVEQLLEHQCEQSKVDIAGRTPLYIASQEGHSRIVKLLLNENFDGFVCDKSGRSPFFVACKGGHVEVVKIFLESKIDVDVCSANGFSPLHIACQQGHAKVVNILLEHNFDVFRCENSQRTALHLACEGGHADVVKLLLKFKSLITKCDINGRSPLYTACEGGHSHVVRLLLQSNTNVAQCDLHGRSPLYVASGWGHSEVVDILLKHCGEDVDLVQHDNRGFNPLHIACYSGHLVPVMLMLNKNFPVCDADKAGQTPLILACKNGHLEVVKILLQNNADISQKDNNGRSPLYVAVKEGFIDIVKLLLDYKADPNTPDNDGVFPWQIAYQAQHSGIIKLLQSDKI